MADFSPILIPVALGAVAVYLLLPRARPYPTLWGALIGGVALVLAGWSLIYIPPSRAETILFYAFSAVAIVSGVLLIAQHNPARAALSFALVVLSTCGLFLLQAAPFLTAATVIIYAGAIIVTFLFVIMLAQQAGLDNADLRSREPLLSTLAGFIVLGGLLWVLHRNYDTAALDDLFQQTEQASRAASVEEIEKVLGDGDDFFRRFRERVAELAVSANERKTLTGALDDAEQALRDRGVDLKGKSAALSAVADKRLRFIYPYGSLQPSGNDLPLSGFSGLRPNLPTRDIPHDRREQVAMPAQNVQSLGQSVFTDYLLAVELAGTLLLVATIGAIAIAGRRAEGLR